MSWDRTARAAREVRAFGLRGLIRTLAWLTLLGLAGLAFRVSYNAIQDVWIRVGAGRAADAWAIPLLFDGLIVVASLVALSRSLDGLRTVYSWVLVAIATLVSVAANIAHARPETGPRLLAAAVPLTLLAAAELVVREVLRTRTRSIQTPTKGGTHASPSLVSPVFARSYAPRTPDHAPGAARAGDPAPSVDGHPGGPAAGGPSGVGRVDTPDGAARAARDTRDGAARAARGATGHADAGDTGRARPVRAVTRAVEDDIAAWVREPRGETKRELADRLGVSESTVRKYARKHARDLQASPLAVRELTTGARAPVDAHAHPNGDRP